MFSESTDPAFPKEVLLNIRIEVVPFLLAALGAGLLLALLCRLLKSSKKGAALAGGIPAVILVAYFLYFFRDPPRTAPRDKTAVVAAADGKIASITELDAGTFAALAARAGLEGMDLATLTGARVTRISIYLSLFDVHVNRAPIACRSRFLGYFPGRHFFTIQEKSSDHNQHNAILMYNEQTTCLVNQIVGPVCRRVVYWPAHDAEVELQMGERIGMMKFGSRLDLYFPSDDITVLCTVADRVRAGETIIGRLGRAESE